MPTAPNTKITATTISKILMNAPPPPVAATGAGAALAAAAGEYAGGALCTGTDGGVAAGAWGDADRAPHLVQNPCPSFSGDPQLVQNAAMLMSPLIRCFGAKNGFLAQHPDREQRDRQPF